MNSMEIRLCYRGWGNSFDVYFIWYDNDGIHSNSFEIEPHEVRAVALTMMEIQLQEDER